MNHSGIEHPSILKVLTALGEVEVASGTPTLVAWTPREALMLDPEHAWLSCEEGVLIRLPLGASELLAAVRADAPAVRPGSELERLLTPCGQLKWAARRLVQEVTAGNLDKARKRCTHLASFAQKYWPGWFDSRLRELRERLRCSDDVVAAHEAADDLVTDSDLVVTVVALEPVIRWSEDDGRARVLAEYQDIIHYSRQGLSAPVNGAIDCLLALRADFETAQHNLDEVIRGGGILPQGISTWVSVLREDLAGDHQLSLEGIDAVTVAIGHLMYFKSQIRMRLQPEATLI